MSVIRMRSALGAPSSFAGLAGATEMVLPPASIRVLAWTRGVILTSPAEVANVCVEEAAYATHDIKQNDTANGTNNFILTSSFCQIKTISGKLRSPRHRRGALTYNSNAEIKG